MYGYKIKINCLPKIVWACETTVKDYDWKNRNKKDMLEICFAKFERLTLILNNKTYHLKNSAGSCILGDENRKCFCESELPITIVSIAVNLCNFEYDYSDFTEADFKDDSFLLLPAFIENIPLVDELEIIKSLHKIIKYSSNYSENNKTATYSSFFYLLHKKKNTQMVNYL